MTSTLDRSTGASESAVLTGTGGSDQPVVSVTPPTKRRPSWAVAGAVLVGVAALLGAYVFTTVTDTIAVTVAATDLNPGETIGAADLRVVEMGRTGDLRAILAEQQDLIIGSSPRAPIPAGTVLNTGLFVDASEVVPAGQVVVGASFKAGEVPTPSLAAGDRVALLAVGERGISVGANTAAATTVVGEGTVWSVTGEATTGGTSERVWVSILVDESLQAQVAQSAADERLRLSLLGR